MKPLSVVGFCLALMAGTALVTYCAFPRHITTGIPQIVTHWDTVEKVVPRLDTLWRTRTLRETETLPNLIETVTVQLPPETVQVATDAVCPQALAVGKAGEQTTVEGQTFIYDSTRALLTRPWRVTYYTPGPLTAMVGDTFPPRLTFGPAPPKPCGTLCRLGLVAVGVLGGAGVTGAACAVSHLTR
jgi:hypothetical protein